MNGESDILFPMNATLMMTHDSLYQHFTALISTSCKFPSQSERNSHVTRLGRASLRKRGHVVVKKVTGITLQNFFCTRNRAFAASRVL